MAYKIENGKVYEIKEVDIKEIEKEINQVVVYVEQQQNSVKPLEAEIAKKKEELNNITTKINNEITLYQIEISKHNEEIEKAKKLVEEKKEIVVQLFPKAKEILGY